MVNKLFTGFHLDLFTWREEIPPPLEGDRIVENVTRWVVAYMFHDIF